MKILLKIIKQQPEENEKLRKQEKTNQIKAIQNERSKQRNKKKKWKNIKSKQRKP